MATLEDIARSLGVSKSTVSKALSGAGDVSEAMRRSVVEAAVELGYSRPLRGEEAPRIAVFIANMDDTRPGDFGYDILVGFRKSAEPAGYSVTVLPLDAQLETDIGYDQYMLQGNYRGGLFLGLSEADPWGKDLETCRTPTVLYDNRVNGNPRVTCVGVDHAEGMCLAVQYLKNIHHQKIGFLSSNLSAYVHLQRRLAFFRALEENGLPHDAAQAKDAPDISVCMNQHLPALLALGCTAILCSHDRLADSALMHCREMGLRVPEDVSIVGFDDLPLSRFTQPPLTTIRQDRTELGKSAYCALSSQMEGVPLSTILLHAELIQRASCADTGKGNAEC